MSDGKTKAITALNVIAAIYGGREKLSYKMGIPVGRIHRWAQTGHIPARYLLQLLKLSEGRVSLAELLPEEATCLEEKTN